MHFSSMKKKMLPEEKAPQMDNGETPPEKPGGTLTGNCTITSLTNTGKSTLTVTPSHWLTARC